MKGTVLLRSCATALSALLPIASPLAAGSMRRSGGKLALQIALGFLLGAALARAVTPDPKLVSLISPTAQIVAGINLPPHSGQPSSFLLATHSNTIDLDGFIAPWGVDHSRAIEQIIMVASDAGGAALAEHSLVANGHFDQALIYKSAHAIGAKPVEYRGMKLLEIQPLARERDSFHDVRWLAMMDSRLAMFGTIGLVRQELDRYLARTPADPSLAQRLAHLRHEDASWCVATLSSDNSEILSIFQLLDARFTDLLRMGDTIQFGIHYGRDVEFEYEVSMSENHDARAIQTFLDQPMIDSKTASFLPAAQLTRIDNGLRGVLKLSKPRYEAWIADTRSGITMRAAGVPGP